MSSADRRRTTPLDPTGMKQGVRMRPRGVSAQPARAAPSNASAWNMPTDDHRIAERQKSVTLCQGKRVQLFPARPRKRLEQDQQRAFGLMEIRQQYVHHGE